MDLDTIVARCQQRFSDPDGHTFSTDEWKAYVNDAYDDVITASPRWPFMEARSSALTASAGSNDVVLPADVWRVTMVFNSTDKFPMRPLGGRSEYRDAYPDLTTQGSPVHYRLRSNTLEVYPTPANSTALTVDYFVHPATLTLGTDEPVFPRPHHKILVDGALAYAYDDDGQTNTANVRRERFANGIMRLMDDLFDPRTERYPTIIDLGV